MKCECTAEFYDRKPDESQRDWLKMNLCQFHWMQTDYYREKFGLQENILNGELLDLILLMPDFQTDEIIAFIKSIREARRR